MRGGPVILLALAFLPLHAGSLMPVHSLTDVLAQRSE